jgi:leucyl aminopeptidase
MNVKPAEVQRWMKADMAGGAAVLGAFWGAARQRLPINVHAVVPLAENLYGEQALRQGDVVTHYNGLTTEITHTDAEGRLVLADCLAYMAESQPEVLVDVATLTNWILGPDLWMVLGTDQALIDELLCAGRRAGEPGWQLPLWPGYADCPTAVIADLQNYDFRETAPDTIVAAHYLKRFAGQVPWAHLDIVGTAFRTERGNDGLLGATGSATRTLLHLLEVRAEEMSARTEPCQLLEASPDVPFVAR